jgi:hypothetical protein
LHAVQTELVSKPLCLPVPIHKAHFLAGEMTSTLPLPPQAVQGESVRKPPIFPCPLHKAQSLGSPYAFGTLATGLPQWLQKLLASGIVFPQDVQRMVPPD